MGRNLNELWKSLMECSQENPQPCTFHFSWNINSFKRNVRPHGEKDNLQLLSTIDLNFIFQNKMTDITF